MTDIGQGHVERQPWGYVATFGWVILALVLSQIIGVAVLAVLRPEAILGGPDLLLKDGVALLLSNIPANVIQVIVLALAARRPGWSVAEYLGLVWPKARDAIIVAAVVVTVVLAIDAITALIGQDVVTPFQLDTYRTARDAGMLPFFWFALVVAAPVAEEIAFRGFLYRGWVKPPRNPVPGILLISALFAIIHIQYDWYGIAQVLVVGIMLGWARWRSGSTSLTILLHMLINLWATGQTMVRVEGWL
jgi:membrane protease YdiL (CAAX protease family)